MADLPKMWELWRHNNGTVYRVALVANADSDRPEYPTTVCYTGDDGHTWAKPLDEFLRKMTRVDD